jgi:hypothetical protein
MSPDDAEWVVDRARAPYPQIVGMGKRLVIGQTRHGTYVQVIYVLDDDASAYVLHCRPLNDSEKRRYRRRTK